MAVNKRKFQERQTLGLIDVLNAIERDGLWFIGQIAKDQGPNSKDENVISLQCHFQNSHGDIVAYRGNVCNQKQG